MVYGLLRFARNDEGAGVFMDCFVALLLAMTKKKSSLREPKARGNLIVLGSSLRGFAEVVAISGWGIMVVKQNFVAIYKKLKLILITLYISITLYCIYYDNYITI